MLTQDYSLQLIIMLHIYNYVHMTAMLFFLLPIQLTLTFDFYMLVYKFVLYHYNYIHIILLFLYME